MAGVRAGQGLGLPVAIDMAENYPAALQAFQLHDGRRPLDLVVRNPRAAARLERTVARRADHILVVCDEMRAKIVGLGADPGRVTVVGNTPDLERFGEVSPPREVASRYADRFVLLYVGEVNPYRGLGTAVDALPLVREKIPNVTLAVVGRGSGIDDLACRAEVLGVTAHLDLVGFRPHEDLAGFIARSDVCLIPHLRTEHIDTTLPNKLFEYMALGRPVLATDALPLDRVITEVGCGTTYRSGDPADMARATLDLADPGRREEMGARGLEAVRRRYNWARDSEILLDIFRSGHLTRQKPRTNIT
jgi:glycosyltransferase involved in cell wall biosynthesis